ncbi:MAG TPA: type IV secretion system DNA-binding domain-containing protein [Opitutaceae bacterium]|nr:type IV secretion system DNA-binding domain-containing protein [Opitutaceae bacterium]
MSANLILSIASAGMALAFWAYSGTGRAIACAFGLLSLWQLRCAMRRRPPAGVVLRLGGFTWDLFNFCRGWLIVGETGSGKTLSCINTMLWQVSKNCPKWGGLCIDDKGLYWETLSTMMRHLGRSDDLILLQVRPEGASADWRPPHTFNFLGYDRLPDSAKAKNVCDVATSLGQGGDQPFFRVQAEFQMEFAFRALRVAGFPVTLDNAQELLASDEALDGLFETLEEERTPEAYALYDHYLAHIANQPPEQFGGVRGTLANRLKHFSYSDIAEVFCPVNGSSFDFGDIDRGKIICVSIPQRYKVERRYIHTLLKLTFYSHVLLRFDRPAEERAKDNLLILWADEAQKIVTANDDGTSDYNVVDVIREARATVVASTQSYTSLIPPMGDEKKAKVFIANMANRVTFKAADEDTARIAADTLGKRKVMKRTYGYSGGKRTTSFTDDYKYFFEPHELRRLRKFQAIVQHCEAGFRKVRLQPTGADGKIPAWHRNPL